MSVVVLSKLEGTDMDLYDSKDPYGNLVTATKVVDISSLCPGAKAQAVLMYACVTRGPVVQLNEWSEKGKDLGVWTYFHYEEMGRRGLVMDRVFKCFADLWDIRPERLAKLIFEHAPRK